MIISCEKCLKKFEIDSDLIPKNGRLLKCGSCDFEWFYTDKIIEKIKPEKKEVSTNDDDIESKNPSMFLEKNDLETAPNTPENNQNIDPSKKKKNSKKKKSINFLNIIIVFIISAVSLILIIDTFNKPISFIIPNIEYILNNLYETLKDIKLFFNDLNN